MATDLSTALREALVDVVQDKLQDVTSSNGKNQGSESARRGLSGMKGVAAGAGLAALAPVAFKGAKQALDNAGTKAGEGVGGKLKESLDDNVGQAGGLGGIAKEAVSGAMPWGGGDDDDDDDDSGGAEGTGKNRRMPVQQAVDVAVPIETAYNQWTQFEDWPEFMFRVSQVSQEDDNQVTFTVKQWNVTRQFTADIETQRPEERIKWKVSQGLAHTGVVTFHELAENLTRIEVTIDVDPSGLIEKAGRGMRHVKRTVRSELHRFKAFIEMQAMETGAWRGIIEDGEVMKEHPEEYDEERSYRDIEDAFEEDPADDEEEDQPEASEDEEGDEEEDEEDEEEEKKPQQSRRGKASSSKRSRSSGNKSRSRSSSNGSGSRSGKSKARSRS